MKPIYLCGPTASGKSAVALELARRLHGEIISVDSMQVYRGLDIGTAKPSTTERAEIPHHLIDVADLAENFDAAAFVRLASTAAAAINRPIFCGGTGLYFNALIHGLGEAPARDPGLRAELEATPLASLLDELNRRDPETWVRIDRKNPRRVVRAVEVIRLTGQPFSSQRSDWSKTGPVPGFIGLEMARPRLIKRIDQRVEAMFAAGLIEETRELLREGLRENHTASQALGYKQVIDHLDGKLGLRETMDLVKLRTRQFAKRQVTWFQRQLVCDWIRVEDFANPGQVADQILLRCRER